MEATRKTLVEVIKTARKDGVDDVSIKKILEQELPSLRHPPGRSRCSVRRIASIFIFGFLPVLGVILVGAYGWRNHSQDAPCVYFVPGPLYELFGPLSDCSMCEGLDEVPKISNITRSEFIRRYGYEGRPVVVTDATATWKAITAFSYDFFKRLYLQYPESLEYDKENGQFFQYDSSISTLQELFNMTEEDVKFKKERWYIGWSTGDVQIRAELAKYFSDPYFLPHPIVDPINAIQFEGEEDGPRFSAWIFMGAPGPGASLHIDQVGSPSWQAQLVGVKTWTLVPPPECHAVCKPLNVTINTGEMIVVDTNRWYHATHVHPGSISITIGSEYE